MISKKITLAVKNKLNSMQKMCSWHKETYHCSTQKKKSYFYTGLLFNFGLNEADVYQVYKYETGNFFEKIHIYLIKMVIHSIFKVMAIASHTFFPSLWQFVYASPKKLFVF